MDNKCTSNAGDLPESIIPIIEKAMGFTLYDWQKDYVLGRESKWPVERASGRTTAYILRLCLMKGEPIHLYPGHIHYSNLPDGDYGSRYADWFMRKTKDIYAKLAETGDIELRPVYFSRYYKAYSLLPPNSKAPVAHEIISLLRAYLDTGLTPDGIKQLQTEYRRLKSASDAEYERKNLDWDV